MSAAAEFMPNGEPVRLPHEPHVLLVLNPGSRRFSAAKQAAEHYYRRGYSERNVDVVHTDMDVDTTKRRIYNRLAKGKYHLVASLTGDGGSNTAAELLIGTDVGLYQGGFGGINDGHLTTVGGNELDLLSFQALVPIYPLSTHITFEGKTSREIALYYQGIGYTALSAELVNSPKHRDSLLMRTQPTKKVREAMTVGKALLLNKPYMAVDFVSGTTESLHEYLISNGPRMAGMPIYPGDPRTPGFKEVRLRWRTGPVAELAKLVMHNSSDWQDADQMTIQVKTKRDGQTIPLQFDGETRRLQSGSIVHTASSEQPLYVVAPALAT